MARSLICLNNKMSSCGSSGSSNTSTSTSSSSSSKANPEVMLPRDQEALLNRAISLVSSQAELLSGDELAECAKHQVLSGVGAHVHASLHVCLCARVHVCERVHMCTYMHACMHICCVPVLRGGI